MSRKKLRINLDTTEDEIRKEIYRHVWYNISSDIRKARRGPSFTADESMVRSFTYAGIQITENPGTFSGRISKTW